MPERIQCKRTKGWRMPDNTVYVGRGSKWGNHWWISEKCVPDYAFGRGYDVHLDDGTSLGTFRDMPAAHYWAARGYRMDFAVLGLDSSVLTGKNLACWCPLDQPCHADVLLELANPDLQGDDE